MSTLDIVFLSLWVLFTGLYWSSYRKQESLPGSALKVAGLLGFVYLVIRGFDWLAAPVPPRRPATDGRSGRARKTSQNVTARAGKASAVSWVAQVTPAFRS